MLTATLSSASKGTIYAALDRFMAKFLAVLGPAFSWWSILILLFPSKSFTTTFEYDQSKYLPTTSYYQIEDYKTNEIIVPFGEYSKLSCDSKSNYFYLDTATYPINRVYKLKLKVVKDGITKIIDDKLTFEII